MSEAELPLLSGAGAPLPLPDLHIEDPFWSEELELVRTRVLPYQWALLNDRVPGVAKSFCMRNFAVAGRMLREQKSRGAAYTPPKYVFRGIEARPEDPAHPDNTKFYGFVFQDVDFSTWIEAAAYSLAQHPDAMLEKTADGAIDSVCAAQQENGYLDTYYTINGMDGAFTNLREHHELYCLGHLIEGAVAYWQATGKPRLLKAACRFADYVYDRFNGETGDIKGYPGHELAELALFRLFEATGNEKYRALATLFLDRRGKRPRYFDKEGAAAPATGAQAPPYQYYQAHKPVRAQTEAVGHAVRAVYLYSGMADAARINGDEKMAAACRALWRDIAARKLYITGGLGSSAACEGFTQPFDLPNDTAFTETCASVGLVFFARRMLALEARSEYADVMERALYNGVLAGMAADGESFFHSNPLEVRPDACAGDPGKAHIRAVRQPWFGCACCPPNLARLVESVGEYAWTADRHTDTLFVHLHLGGRARLLVNGTPVSVVFRSALPWRNTFSAGFSGCGGAAFTLAVRIPQWCDGSYSLTGADDARTEQRAGYLYLTKAWSDADTLQFSFSMRAQYIAANPRVAADAGRVCIQRGPIVYCLEQADNGPALHLCRADPTAPLTVAQEELLPGGMPVATITTQGWRLPPDGKAAPLYATAPSAVPTAATLKFIPYYLWANRGEGEMCVWVQTR